MDVESEWNGIKAEILACSRCPLSKFRTRAVPGEGNIRSSVMLLGEAPGKSEDEEGRPFVGAAGRLLNRLIEEVGMRREDFFITNVVKCRPPNNREPRPDEILACSYFTDRVISLMNPKAIVALGNYAGYYLFELRGGARWLGVTRMRGRTYRLPVLGSTRLLIPTYHPAAALYNPQLYETMLEDFRLLKKVVEALESGTGLLRFVRPGGRAG